ncbi:diguanylate cyclase/cyclic diguanylate phosphodiesterase [Klebsiella quasipneumoniae]|nr:diguanylate cyclase/cyclic diguanylate phosphodiesterase [Klebsiella quasipneumoniae]
MRPYNGCAVVMLFDLDSFKDVNDTLGHDAGDKLLQDLASRLSFFRKTSETLYRLGGDEFAMLSYDLTEEMALERANVIREKISQPYQIYDAQINIDACIGIVISDGESRTDYLYKCADLALYEAKKEGCGHVQIFRPGMLQRLQENKSFEDDLLQALSHDEFKVYYQPIADTVTREIYGYEALVRWFHPVRGAVPPTVFYPGGRENRPYQCPRRVGAENRLCRSGQLGDAAQGLGQRFADSADEHLADRHHYQRIAADWPRPATVGSGDHRVGRVQ